MIGMDVLVEGVHLKKIKLEIRSPKDEAAGKVGQRIDLKPGAWSNLDHIAEKIFPYTRDFLNFTVSHDIGKFDSTNKGFRPQIDRIVIKTYVQLAHYAVPELKLGENEVCYSDSSDERNVEIKIQCDPITDVQPPPPPRRSFYPENNSSVHDSKIRFSWSPSVDLSGGGIKYYHFQLSGREDMLYPLSPNFDRRLNLTLSKNHPYYILPYYGLLHPGKDYYWRVRAIDSLFSYKIRFLKYHGHRTCKKDYFLGLWDQPEYNFSAEGLPDGLTLDEESGIIKGVPEIGKDKPEMYFEVSVLKNGEEIRRKKIKVTVED